MLSFRVYFFLLLLYCCINSTVNALNETHNLGIFKIEGQDAQQSEIKFETDEITPPSSMSSPINADIILNINKPQQDIIQEKAIASTIEPSQTGFTVYMAGGNNSYKQSLFAIKGLVASYSGELMYNYEKIDAYKSYQTDEQKSITANLTNHGEGKYSMSLSSSLEYNKIPQRGTITNPTPNALIDDDKISVSLQGNSVLSDGGFFNAALDVTNIDRKVSNVDSNFSESNELFSSKLSAEYQKSLNNTIFGKISIDLKHNKYDSENNFKEKLYKRKTTLEFSYSPSKNTNLTFGFNDTTMKNKDHFSPNFSLKQKLNDSLKFSINYFEDLQNDSLETIFLQKRYVPIERIKPSVKKEINTIFSYNFNSTNLSLEFFKSTENDFIEYWDAYDGVKKILTSKVNFVDKAKNSGFRIKSNINIDNNLIFKTNFTFQDPKNDKTGKKLSYNPEKIIDVSLSYTEKDLSLNISRYAMFDRIAYTPQGIYKVDDYSRTDLILQYKFNDNLQSFIKVKDLYDEAKKLRLNVDERGRVTIMGIQLSFK